MPESGEEPTNGLHRATGGRAGPADDDPLAVSEAAFKEHFNEDIRESLDVLAWRLGQDLSQEYARIEREVHEAEQFETDKQRRIRDELFPRLATLPNLRHAGKHKVDPEDVARVHRGLLFNGGVEACDGAIQVHDTLPLTIYQIGVSLVSYRGDQGTWGQRLFRRDLRQKGVEVDEWIEFLERRARRDSDTRPPGGDRLGELVQKALLQYAERAILLRRSTAVWRLGHGNPVPYELLTGGGNLELMVQATQVLRELVEGHRKFLFVASEPRDRLYLTIGRALHPLEYAIVDTLDHQLDAWLHQDRFKLGAAAMLTWDLETIPASQWIPRFIEQVASKIVVGVFRPTQLANTHLFYAHVDHAEVAARIALADSALKEQGTSLLLEMAKRVCDSVFGDSLEALATSAHAVANGNGVLTGPMHRLG